MKLYTYIILPSTQPPEQSKGKNINEKYRPKCVYTQGFNGNFECMQPPTEPFDTHSETFVEGIKVIKPIWFQNIVTCAFIEVDLYKIG